MLYHRKGNSGIAIGNALGSNVFNILAILGITGMITPMTLKGITYIDLSMLVISIMLVWLFSFTKYKIERWEGACAYGCVCRLYLFLTMIYSFALA